MEDKRYINQLEVITNIFTLDKNSLKVYLIRRTEEPYKGYWMLPSNLLMTTETIMECANATSLEFLGLDNIKFIQCDIFSQIDRLPNDRIIGNSVIGLVDAETLRLRKKATDYEGAWFSINEIPKMVFDYEDILKNATSYLSKNLLSISLIKVLFPSDFTLSELQVLYEQVLNKKLDRRNFRKKIFASDIIESTGYKTENKIGRPAELYHFKDVV